MREKHYIGVAGIHGCLPSVCDVYESRKAAAESLAQIHERGKRFAQTLASTGYAELRPQDGNDYCEISPCSCENPDEHSDSY